MTIQVIGILGLFVLMVVLMMTRKLPTILALPIMAVGIALIAGIPFMGGEFSIAKDVLEAGAMRMSTAIAGLFFGGFFGKVLSRVGITNTIIRKAAEMAGDKPLPIAYAFLIVTSVIFAASNGLGMFILVGTIIVPIMISAGLSPLVAGTILLLGNGVGVTFSVGTLGVYIDTLGLPLETVTQYSFLCAAPLIVVAVIMVYVMVKSGGKKRKAWAMPASDMGGDKNVRSIVVSSSFVEGIQETAGACGLMIGIGMVLKAVMAPEVAAVLEPVIKAIIPSSAIMFVLVFGLLSPLAIYRGPLNVWGLGSGIVALLASCGMNPVAAMVALRLDSNVQAVCDPTNSHNVWISDFTKTDVNDYLKKTILWIAVSTLAGLIVASFIVL